jgi:hypothetical protein
MGLRNSKDKLPSDLIAKINRIDTLEKRVQYLEKLNDELIKKLSTYREIEIKVDECYEKVGLDKTHKYQKSLIKTELALNDARKYIADLEKQLGILNELHRKHHINTEYNLNALEVNDNKPREITLNELSKKQIENLVNKLLADEAINIKYFPDWVERQLYINVINLIIHLLEQFLSGASINMMGHSIGFTLVPLPETIQETIQ